MFQLSAMSVIECLEYYLFRSCYTHPPVTCHLKSTNKRTNRSRLVIFIPINITDILFLQKPDNVDEAPLQAVVLADSYNRRFEVLCTDQPRVLLPLCSTPLLAWTLESLSLSKVKQVFIFCGVHADKIRAFIESSPYRAMLDIHCLSSQTAQSAGDALRELDDMHVSRLPIIIISR